MRLLTGAFVGLVLVAGPATPENAKAKEAHKLIDGWTAAVNAGKGLEAIDQFFAPDYVWHVPGEDIRGREAFKGVFAKFSQKCPAVSFTPLEVVSEKDFVSVRWSGKMHVRPSQFHGVNQHRSFRERPVRRRLGNLRSKQGLVGAGTDQVAPGVPSGAVLPNKE